MTPKSFFHFVKRFRIEPQKGSKEKGNTSCEVFDPTLVGFIFKGGQVGLVMNPPFLCLSLRKPKRMKIGNGKGIRGVLDFDIPPIIDSLRPFVWLCFVI